MQVNDFIKEHINIDNRERINRRLYNLSKKYKEFGYYLDIVQKENIGLILHYLMNNKFIFKNALDLNNFKYYINQLIGLDLIERVEPQEDEKIIGLLGEYNAMKMSYYILTNKGQDFLRIEYIKEYLEGEYGIQ